MPGKQTNKHASLIFFLVKNEKFYIFIDRNLKPLHECFFLFEYDGVIFIKITRQFGDVSTLFWKSDKFSQGLSFW